MSFSPLIFLIIYVVLVGIFLFISILNFYHVVRYGFFDAPSIAATLIYLLLVAMIILFTFRALGDIDWKQPIQINLPFISSTNEEFK
jgi:uncharacterized membrane protein YbhN (UPF0104 family)